MDDMDNFLRSRLKGEYGAEHDRFVVETDDGESIHGVLVKSGGKKALLFCHGLLASKNHLPVQRFVSRLAESHDIAAFDFRGHGESTGVSSLAADEIRDVSAVIDHLRERGYEQLVGIGTSMGGATLLRYQARRSDLAGVVSIGSFCHAERMHRPTSRLALRLVFDTPAARPLVRLIFGTRPGALRGMVQPIEAVKSIASPLLLVHGGWDLLVECSHARELAAAAGGPVQLELLPRRGHVESLLADDTRRLIDGWLAEHGLA